MEGHQLVDVEALLGVISFLIVALIGILSWLGKGVVNKLEALNKSIVELITWRGQFEKVSDERHKENQRKFDSLSDIVNKCEARWWQQHKR